MKQLIDDVCFFEAREAPNKTFAIRNDWSGLLKLGIICAGET